MSNYTFFDAASSVKTAMSSTISGVELPVVKISDPVSVVGTIGASIIGAVPIVQSGLQITSVSGTLTIASLVSTYAEDAAHNSGDAGLFVLGVRNDTLSSITNADGDYSPMAVGPVGEGIVANAPLTKWVQGASSVFYGSSVQLIAAQGSSVFTYVTGVQVANASGNNVYLTFYGATDSVVGYLPVPANGGAIPIMPNAWKTKANGVFSASISGAASVYLSAQGFISKV